MPMHSHFTPDEKSEHTYWRQRAGEEITIWPLRSKARSENHKHVPLCAIPNTEGDWQVTQTKLSNIATQYSHQTWVSASSRISHNFF